MRLIGCVFFRVLIKLFAFIYRHSFEEDLEINNGDIVIRTIIGTEKNGVVTCYCIHMKDYAFPKDHIKHLYHHYKYGFIFYIKGINSIPSDK